MSACVCAGRRETTCPVWHCSWWTARAAAAVCRSWPAAAASASAGCRPPAGSTASAGSASLWPSARSAPSTGLTTTNRRPLLDKLERTDRFYWTHYNKLTGTFHWTHFSKLTLPPLSTEETTVTVGTIGCFIFLFTFSPNITFRPDSHYFISFINFGASYSALKPISCYAEIRRSCPFLCWPALKLPVLIQQWYIWH